VSTGAGASVNLPGASVQLEGKAAADAKKAAEAAAAAKASKEQAAASAAASKQAAADQAAAAKTAAADQAAAAKAAAAEKASAAQANASAKLNAGVNAQANAQANASAKFVATDRAALRAYQANQARAAGQAGLINSAANRMTNTLPSGWKRNVKAGAKLDANVAAAGTKVEASSAVGFGPKVEGSQVIIVQDRAILVDSKTSVVLDVIKL
jgi:colicin import membrane protein